MEIDLETAGGRLRKAREDAGFNDAAAFAKLIGVNPVTYRAHEANQNGYCKSAEHYAAKLKVTPWWLLFGIRGDGTTQAWIPSEATLEKLLGALAPALLRSHGSESALRAVAPCLSAALQSLAAQPADADDPAVVRIVAQRLSDDIDRGMSGTHESGTGNR